MCTIEKAIEIAARAHAGQVDKAGEPYIFHPLRLMLSITTDYERMAAVLHDVVEDTSVSLKDLKSEGFPEEVLEAIAALTKTEGESRLEAARRAARNPIARTVKLADVKDNMDLTRIAHPTEKDYARLREYEQVKQFLESSPLKENQTVAIIAEQATARSKPSSYPEPFASRMAGREKRPLGDGFGLTNFGVNLTRLAPGSLSALRHAHSKQDEFIYILQGNPTLCTDEGRTLLSPGMCAGFKAGTGNAHHLINETPHDVVYLEVGDRTPDDEAAYPDDDLQAVLSDGKWLFAHKDGTPY